MDFSYSSQSNIDEYQQSLEFDWISYQFMTKTKYFKNFAYLQQKNLVHSLKSILGEKDVDTNFYVHQEEIDSKRVLIYLKYYINLADYLQNMKMMNTQIILSIQNLKYLFKIIFTNINLMASKRYYYSDYKPQQFVLIFDRFKKKHILKLTQIEIINNELYPTQFTEEFFSSPNILQNRVLIDKKIRTVFTDHTSRYKNEVYIGMRAFLYLCLNQKGVSISNLFNDVHTIEKNTVLIDYIISDLYKDILSDKKLNDIFNFFRNEVLQLNQFSYMDIDNLLNGIRENHFQDQLDVLQQIDVQIQNIYINKDEKCFSQLFGVYSVIELKCSQQGIFESSGNLFNEINKFISQEYSSDDNQSVQIFIILGQSGMGKSFSINTYGFLMMNQAYQNPNIPLPILLDCAEHSRDDIQKLLNKFMQIKQEREKIILLDNYDHIFLEQNVNILKFFNIQESDKIKIVLTAKANSFSQQDYMDYFELRTPNKYITYTRFYLSILENNQRMEYFDQFLQNCYQHETSQKLQLTTYPTPQQYENLIDKNQEIKQLAITPINLKLISLILPLMDTFNSQQMYKLFIKQFVLSSSLSIEENEQIQLDLVKEDLGIHLLDEIEYPFDDFCINLSQQMYIQNRKFLTQEEVNIQGLKFLQIDEKVYQRNIESEIHSNMSSSIDVDLAQKMSPKGPLKTFKRTYFELKFLIKFSPIIQKNNETYEFYHTCIYQYYINRSIQLELQQLFNNIKKDRNSLVKQMQGMFCNNVVLSNKERIIQDIANSLKMNSDNDFKQIIQNLLKIVYYSRYSKDIDNISAFAFTLINNLGFSFSNLDLTNVRLPNASFGNGIFYTTNFSNTYLQKANFQKSILSNAVFTESTLTDCVFDTYPTLIKDNYYPQCMVLSYDGQSLFTGGFDGIIICWDLLMYEEKFTLDGGVSITAIAINIKDTLLATSGSDWKIILWNIVQKFQVQVFSSHQEEIKSLSFSRDCQLLASGGSDKRIKIYDLINLAEIHDFSDHESQINCIEFSYDSKNIAGCCEGGFVYIWFLEVGKILFSFQSEEQEIYRSLVYFREGRFLISGGSSKFIKIWDLSSGQIHRILQNQSETNQLSLSKDEKTLIACSNKAKMITLWNLLSFHTIRSLTFDQVLTSAFFTMDQCRIMMSDELGYINSISYKEQHINLFEKKQNYFFETPIVFCQFSHQNFTNLLCISRQEGIKILDIERNNQIEYLDEKNIDYFCFTEDGKRFAINQSELIQIYDIQTLKEEQIIYTRYQTAIAEMKFSYDNKFLVCLLKKDSLVNIWQLDKTKEVKKLDHGAEVIGFSFSRDNNFILTSGNYIKLWIVQTFEQVKVIKPLQDHVFTVGIFSKDSNNIICGTQQSILNIIKINDKKEFIKEIPLHVTDPITQHLTLQVQIDKIFLNNEGTIVVCVMSDENNTVFLYDQQMGRDLEQIKCQHKVHDCSFSSDDRYLSIAHGSKIEIWTNWTMVWNDKQEIVDYKKNINKWFLYKILTNNLELQMEGLNARRIIGLSKVQTKIIEQQCGLKLIMETEQNGIQCQMFEKDKNFKRKRAIHKLNEEEGIISFFESKQRLFNKEEQKDQMQNTISLLKSKVKKQKKQIIKKEKRPFYNSMELIKLKDLEVDQIVNQKLTTTIEQRRTYVDSVISKIPYKCYNNPVPIFYQVSILDQSNKQIAAKLQEFLSCKKLIVEATTTLQKLKLIVVKLEKFPANELILIYAGNQLIKGDIDVGNLQQIYGDYQDGWLYLTVVRSGVQIDNVSKKIKQSLTKTKK